MTGTALPKALAITFDRLQPPPSPSTRGAIQDIAYRTMRRWGTACALLRVLVARKPSAAVEALLGCALALLSEDTPAYAAFTVVDQTVDAAAARRDTQAAKGMINAVLRRFLRERDDLIAQVMKTAEGRWNYPAWWIDACRAAWPDDWEQILATGNQTPPLTLRVNLRRTSVTACLDALAKAGMAADTVGPQALRLQKAVPVQQIPGFAEGWLSVQDAAAQRAAPLLELADGMRVLDACAAPGGKTGHLLETANVELLALDHDPQRLRRVEENLIRLGLHATLRTGDAAGQDWWDGKPFDRILADVPCTASGIVRRHPDIRWLRRPDDAEQLAQLSRGILDNLWSMLLPGGLLLLVTCSIWPVESEEQAAAFAARHHAVRLPATGQLLPVAQASQDHDGLFYALFQKPVV